LIAAFWVGYAVPVACVWILIADRHRWLDENPILASIAAAGFFGPLVFIVWLEYNRRKLKANRENEDKPFRRP
jgi:hypothetical protein